VLTSFDGLVLFDEISERSYTPPEISTPIVGAGAFIGASGDRMAFVRAAAVSDIAPGRIRQVEVNGKAVALANVGGTFHAIDNTCLHRGGPLGDGSLEGKIVTCPWHGWQFDVTTGKSNQNPAVGVSCYLIEVRGGEVFVDFG
jgi:nitrite reductase (NADH) small subunit